MAEERDRGGPARQAAASQRLTGRVKWFNGNYGFIERDTGDEVFVHQSEVIADGFRTLKEGQFVEFTVGLGPKGRMQAQGVRVVQHGDARVGDAVAAAPLPHATLPVMRQRESGCAGDEAHPGDPADHIPVRNDVETAIPDRATSHSFHLGLRFFKYVDTWPSNWRLDDAAKRNRKREFLEVSELRNGQPYATGGIVKLNDRLRAGVGQQLLADAHCRLNALTSSLASQGWEVTARKMRTAWRLVSGLGISHPFETGLALHHTLGVPYLPGPSVKGAAGAAAKDAGRRDEAIFGDDRSRGAGQVIFFDALPSTWPVLELDIINPHYADYYENGVAPGDWLSPRPINFLAVAPGQPFTFIVAARARPGSTRSSPDLAKTAMEFVEEAARTGGLGGKSAVGYGYFV